MESQKNRYSRAVAMDTAASSVRRVYEDETLPKSIEGQAMAATLDLQIRSLVEGYRSWLARSDHEPIRAQLELKSGGGGGVSGGGGGGGGGSQLAEGGGEGGGGVLLRVASHNVQERVTNGIQTYTCHMPFLTGMGKGASKTLMEKMLDPTVTDEHVRQVVGLVERELFVERSADAVCLQEISTDMVEELQRTFGGGGGGGGAGAARPSWVHASAVPNPNAKRSPKECAALTCIVSAVPFVPLRDVAVVTQQASKSVGRNYATVLLTPPGGGEGGSEGGSEGGGGGGGVVLSSVHVRHAATHNTDVVSSATGVTLRNNANIDDATEVSVDP